MRSFFLLSLLVAFMKADDDRTGQSCTDDETDFEPDDDVEVCANDGSDYTYEETIQANNERRVIKTTHCPNHKYLSLNPNFPVKSERTYRIPLYPKYSANVQISLTNEGGPIGVLFDGAMLYSAYGGSSYPELDSSYANDYDNSAPAVEGWSFDMCGQHASSSTQASWHSHVPPSCLLDQLGQTEFDHSPQVGWAVDGFPVYGPRGPSGTLMKGCQEESADPTYCTDTCGGYYDDSIGDGYTYRYYMQGHYNRNEGKCNFDFWADLDNAKPNCDYSTSKEFYPFTPLCFHGCCPDGVSCGYSGLPTCDDNDSTLEDGTTDDFDDTFENSELEYYDGVDECTCDNNFHTECTNYQSGEDCTSDSDCAYGLECKSRNCVESEPTTTPTSSPSYHPTTLAPTRKPTLPLPTGVPTSPPPTPSPTTSFVTVQGEIIMAGMTEEAAVDNEEVIVNAIAESVEVSADQVSIVSMTEEDSRRRRRRQLLEETSSSVLVVYTITVPSEDADEVMQNMDSLDDGTMEEALMSAATSLGSSYDFSSVSIESGAGATLIDPTSPHSSSSSSNNKKKKKHDGGSKTLYTAILILLIIAIVSQVIACCAYCFYYRASKSERVHDEDNAPKPVIYTELTKRKNSSSSSAYR